MTHVFLLLVYLGTGETRKLISNDMYFYNINECLYFASRVSERKGNYKYLDYMDPKDRATAYCIPTQVNLENVRVY